MLSHPFFIISLIKNFKEHRSNQMSDIVQLVQEYVLLEESGENYKGCCPFHNEATSSFIVNPRKEIFHCFGCGQGGSINDFRRLVREYNIPKIENQE